MLYRGSEIMREVAWVVFDEIHYMRDAGMYIYVSDQLHLDLQCRTRGCMGGNHYPSTTQSQTRLLVRHNTQCYGIC